MTDAERYAISVRKVRVDDEEMWRATVRELPDLAEFAETRDEAIDLALDAIETLKVSAAEEGWQFPEPIEDEEEYSGRVTLRLPKSLHRAIALKAVDEDVSLNSYICTVLTANINVFAAPVHVSTAAAAVNRATVMGSTLQNILSFWQLPAGSIVPPMNTSNDLGSGITITGVPEYVHIEVADPPDRPYGLVTTVNQPFAHATHGAEFERRRRA